MTASSSSSSSSSSAAAAKPAGAAGAAGAAPKGSAPMKELQARARDDEFDIKALLHEYRDFTVRELIDKFIGGEVARLNAAGQEALDKFAAEVAGAGQGAEGNGGAEGNSSNGKQLGALASGGGAGGMVRK